MSLTSIQTKELQIEKSLVICQMKIATLITIKVQAEKTIIISINIRIVILNTRHKEDQSMIK